LSYALEAFDAKKLCGCAAIGKGWGSIVEWWDKGNDSNESDVNVVADGDCNVRRNMAISYTVRRCHTDGAIIQDKV